MNKKLDKLVFETLDEVALIEEQVVCWHPDTIATLLTTNPSFYEYRVEDIKQSVQYYQQERKYPQVSILLKKKEAEFLLEKLYELEDEGPTGEGWQSNELKALTEKIKEQVK